MDTNLTPKIIVGISTVLEFYWDIDERHQTAGYSKNKGKLRIEVGGSAYNILKAMISQGYNPDFIQFIGETDTDYGGILLKNILQFDGMRTTTIPCLSNTRVSSIRRIKHLDGTVQESIDESNWSIDTDLFESHYEAIKNAYKGFDWKIISGVKDTNEENRLLTDNFDSTSNNVLIPKIELVRAEHWKKIVPLMDIIFMNKVEFEASKMSIDEYHKLGLPLLVITNNEKGGKFSFNGVAGKYEAYKYGFSEIYETGAGDWFASSSCLSLINNGIKKVREAGFENIMESMRYGSKIAGIKVGTPGASKGPSGE